MTTREMMAPLRERPFRLLFGAQATSVVGDQIAPIAIAFAILGLGGSAGDLGLALAARMLPLVLFVLVGGVWADRVPRHRLMVVSNLGSLGSQGLLAFLLIGGTAEIWHVVALQAVAGTAMAFFRPAADGLTPATVSPANLQRANGLLSLTHSLAQVLGPAIAGVLVATVGPGWAIGVDAATFAVSALFLSRLRLPARARAAGAVSFRADLRGGWDAVVSRTWLWTMIAVFGLFQILVLATFFVLGPVIAERDLGGAPAWALIVGAWGGGAVVGALIGMRVHPRRPLVACNTAILLVVAPMLLLAAGAPAPAVALGAAGAGLSMSFGGVLWETTVQERVPDELLSRVSAYDWMGSTALRPIGYAAVGPVAEIAGASETLVIAAAATTVVMVASLSIPAIRQLERAAGGDLPGAPARE